MKKIIHLSDLHYGSRRVKRDFKKIIDNIMKLTPADEYVIVITGDLIDNGFNERHHEECKIIFDTLEAANFKVLFVPGNHDYGNFGYGVDIGRVKIFNRIYFQNENKKYPLIDYSEDEKIAFIGLDSMAESFGPGGYSSGAAGRLGTTQLEGLKKALNNSQVRACEKRVAYLHHNPFKGYRDNHKLKDAEQFCRILLEHRDIVDALLFGHNHMGTEWNGWLEGISRCYDAGTSTRKRVKPGGLAPHRVIDLSLPQGSDYDGDFH